MSSEEVRDPMDEISSLKSIECGEDAAKHFAFDKGYRNLNHGSFGTAPTAIRKVQQHFRDQTESRPDAAIRYVNPEHLDTSRAAVARHLHVSPETCVFVPNATTGVNTVLRNLVFKPGDVIIYFATIYGACEKSISYIQETTPAEACKIQYTYPLSDDQLCNLFETAITKLKCQGKTPKLAIFDTIVALPGVLVPFTRLTKICKAHSILSCIDGAHGIGHIPLDLSDLDPDFFVSNCHKWLFVPRGCAVFYVPIRNQNLIRSTLPTSHGFVPLPEYGEGINNPLPPTDKSDFVTQFEFVGTLDDSPYLCIPAALEWRSKVRWRGRQGDQAVMGYCLWLGRRAGEIVRQALGTEILENEQRTLGECNFANVRLPLDAKALTGGDAAQVAKVGQWIVRLLVREYGTFIAIIYYAGAWWMRLSAQIYLTEEDFEWSGRVLLEICQRVEAGEWKENDLKPKL